MAWSDMHAKRTWRKKMSQHQTNLMWFLFSTVYLHRVTLYKAFIKMLTAATPWLLVFAYHTICSVYCSCICHQPTMGHATSHLRNKFGLSQREIEWTEGVRSQRDLHLLCGIAQLALNWRNLHNSLQSGFAFRCARGQPKQSASMHQDCKQAKARRKKLPCLGYWKNFHPSHSRMWEQWLLIPEH